ncbi:MAG: phospholipase A [Arcobacteraceae bacterium]
MRQIFTFCIVFLYILLADDRLEQAQNYEKQGNYKEAMLLYKQLATQNSLETSLLEENKEDTPTSSVKEESTNHIKRGLVHIKNSFETVNDKKTNNTIEQILSSSFDLYPYKENYLLPFSYDIKKRDDRNQEEAVFQISVKKPITYDLLGQKETIYFGYTQKSFWQVYAHSSPFRETNYQPEVYALVPFSTPFISSLKAYKVGFLHESNGQRTNSRSWNRFYLAGYFQTDNIFIIPRVWLRVPERKSDDDNPNIEEYLGYGDINILYAYKEHTFKLLLRNNLKPNDNNKGFAELNWSFPLFSSLNNFAFVQLSSGYGDSLVDYDQEINRISFGISLSR